MNMDKNNVIKLWKESVGELPRIEYNNDGSFAVLYTEQGGEWLRNNGKLLKFPCLYQLTEENPNVYSIHGIDTGSSPEDSFMAGFQSCEQR